MHNLRRFYYRNKKRIWQIILFIAFIIILIQVLNYMTKISNNEIRKHAEDNSIINNNLPQNTEMLSNQSAVSGEKIDIDTIGKAQRVIEEFISNCNNKEIEKAYNLLSSECKKELYSNKKEFENKYIKNNFPYGSTKIAQIENWVDNIYKVNIIEDIMATGSLNASSIQDYITIVDENNEKRLNINNFIGQNDIQKVTIQNDVEVTVLSKKMYMNYEEYTFKINNKTENDILLDTLDSTKTIYLKDQNENKYYAYTQELIKEKLKINSGFSTQINIKFYKTYSSTRKVEEIIFSDFIINDNNENEKISLIISF